MNLFDQLILLLTGLTAAYLTFRLYQEFSSKSPAPKQNIHYMISFIVLLISGLLLIALGWGILKSPLVVIVTTFLPMTIATGLMCEFYSKIVKPYLLVSVLGLLLIILSRFDIIGGSKIFLPLFHSMFGLTIFLVPIMVVREKLAPSGFIFVTVGGTLIGLGGIALGFLTAGKQLLFFSGEFVMLILAPLLFLMTLAYTYGFMKKMAAAKDQ